MPYKPGHRLNLPISKMDPSLYLYLLQHKSLSIPGLGTLYVERVPAQSDFINRQILAPSYHYRFDKYFDSPDKDFFTYLAQQRTMVDYEAIRWYNEWAYDLRNQIRTDQPFVMKGIGTLKKDYAGEIVFEAEQALPTYLKNVPAKRLVKSKTTHIVRVGDHEVAQQFSQEILEEEAEQTSNWWVWALAIAAIALLILFFHFYNEGFTLRSIGSQA